MLDRSLCVSNRSWYLVDGVEEDLQVECVSDTDRVLRGVDDVTKNENCYKDKKMDMVADI